MSRKSRRKKTHGPQKAPSTRIGVQSKIPALKSSRLKATWDTLRGLSVKTKAFLGSTAVAAVYTAFLHFVNGSVSVAFSKPLHPGYEFVVSNDSPVEQTIEHFRIEPENGSKVIFKATETMGVPLDSRGRVPAGRVPAAEYHDLDGQAVGSQQRMNFRVPPLIDWAAMRSEASLVSVTYRAIPKQPLLRYTAMVLEYLGVVTLTDSQHYLVIDDYWTPTTKTEKNAAIRQACAEHAELRQYRMCDD
ncbi:hypothetical protein AB4Y38_12435 [Paraburkholderia sp. EG285A]|uniref:hypothetical protein n=1 Tax=Paraburkholderia sp. EG285A TaxID=3237009 RepID=UPI0034D1E2D9